MRWTAQNVYCAYAHVTIHFFITLNRIFYAIFTFLFSNAVVSNVRKLSIGRIFVYNNKRSNGEFLVLLLLLLLPSPSSFVFVSPHSTCFSSLRCIVCSTQMRSAAYTTTDFDFYFSFNLFILIRFGESNFSKQKIIVHIHGSSKA